MVEIPEHLLKRSREAMARAKAKKGEAPPPEETAEAPQSEEVPEAAAQAVAAQPEAEPPAAEVSEDQEPRPTEIGAAEIAGQEAVSAVAGEGAGTSPAVGGAPVAEPASAIPYSADELVEAAPGIREVVTSRAPGWLVAVFVLVPLVSLLYMTQFSHGTQCGQAGTLQVGSEGQLLGCDGRPLPSPGTGAKQQALPDGRAIFAQRCAACHGPNGEGGVGPPLNKNNGTMLLEDFPDVASQVDFVAKGSQAFPDGWGAKKKKPSATAMPAFGNTLSKEEIEAVVRYERELAGEVQSQ